MRKLIPVLIVAALILSLLAACTTTPQSVTPTPSTDAGDAHTPSPTPSTDASDAQMPATTKEHETTVKTGGMEIPNYNASDRNQEFDDVLLCNYHEASLNDSFEDNRIVVIFKYNYIGEIDISYFDRLGELATVISIQHENNTIQNNETITITDRNQRMIYLTLKEHDKNTVLSVVKELMLWEDVLVAEPKYIRYVAWNSISDPLFDDQNSLQPLTGIDIESAWTYSTGNTNIIIGIFEDGVDLTHPDLNGRVANANYSGTYSGSHGTLVAGIIGATRNNNIGISGISQSSIYVLDTSQFFSSLYYARYVLGIRIINCSFCFVDEDDKPTVFSAEEELYISSIDCLLVCAAGNEGSDMTIESNRLYPACYTHTLSNVISVGSCDPNGTRSNFSNYGVGYVDLYAPGREILSTYPTALCNTNHAIIGSGEYDPRHIELYYHINSGTSFAAPHVTGVASLLLSLYPDMTPAQLKAHLINGASSGRLNAGVAMNITTSGYVDIGDNTYHYAKCTVCNGTHETTGVLHDYGAYTYSDGTQHFRECSVCGHRKTEAHTFSSTVTYLNNSNHYRTCTLCGYQQNEAHVIGAPYSAYSDDKHYATCSICAGQVEEAHTPTGPYTYYNDYRHSATCSVCANSIHVAHTIVGPYTGYDGDYHYANCSVCNHQVLTTHTAGAPYTFYNNKKHYATCTKCGTQTLRDHTSNGIYVNKGDNGHRTYCTKCNSYYLEAHHWVFNNASWRFECLYCPAISSTGQSPYSHDDEELQ